MFDIFHSKGLHNFAHPRTDAVVIMAVIDESGEKVLLGRNVSHLSLDPHVRHYLSLLRII